MYSRITSVPLIYLLLWCASLALSIILVALLRTRWGRSRPLHKCAVLSLLVHLLLAWAAMTLRFVMGDGGSGVDRGIRVRIVQDPTEVPRIAPDFVEVALETPPLLDPPAEPVEANASQAEEPDADMPRESPAVAATPAEMKHGEIVPDDMPAVAEADQPVANEPQIESAQTAPGQTPDVTPPAATLVAAIPAVDSPYALRHVPDRLSVVERQGGSTRTEASVAAALHWLASAQARDGRWDAVQHGGGQEPMVLGHNRGGAGRGADAGISALALLAFLGAGHTHQHGEYQETVRRGLDFLLRCQSANGSIFGEATLYAQMYCHSMATFALAEAMAMTADRRLEPAVANAVAFCVAAQSPSDGGWRYRPGDPGDMSQLGWQMMALASARRASVEVPPQTWLRVERFLRSVRRGHYGGLASYRPDSGPSTSMTAEAFYCRLLLGDVTGQAIEAAPATEATNQLLAALPDAHRVNLYYWYYATLALQHEQQANDAAADAWTSWNEALVSALLANQIASGPNGGSWDTNTVWGGYGGRVYTTAMAAMCLEVYYRYAPATRKSASWTAARHQIHETPR